MSNMLSLSRDSLRSDECVYRNGADWVSSICVCVRVRATSPPTKGPSFLIKAHLSGPCLIIYVQRGHFVRAASSAASSLLPARRNVWHCPL